MSVWQKRKRRWKRAARERYQAELAAYQEKLRERERKAQERGRKPGGRPPQPPEPGPRVKDQYNFTDPESRIMKNSSDDGFDQRYNVQVAVEQGSLLIIATTVSPHANDKGEAVPTVAAIDERVGQPEAVALDNGYFSEHTIEELEERQIEPYIATGRDSHHRSWRDYFGSLGITGAHPLIL